MSSTTFKMAGKTLEIMFYGDIGDEFEGITAKRFADDLKSHSDASHILVRMNSIGGTAYDGAAIYNTLARHKARVEVEVDGIAASAASLVAMAGEEIRMAENAFMMIHKPLIGRAFLGNEDDLAEYIDELEKDKDTLKKMSETYAGTYSKRSGQPKSEVLSMMKAETWMTAEEAVEFGFADSVIGSRRLAARAVPEGMFKKTPPSLLVRDDAMVVDYRAKLEEALKLK